MIQKIRSYILESDTETKNSFMLVIALVLFSPSLIFFVYEKYKSNKLAKVDNLFIDKREFKLRIQEQYMIVEKMRSLLNKEIFNYFLSMVYGGRSIEEFVIDIELKNTILRSLFIKNIKRNETVSDFMIEKYAETNKNKIKGIIGELFFSILEGEKDLVSIVNKEGISNKLIDQIAENVCCSVFMKNLLNSYTLSMEGFSREKKEIKSADFDFFELDFENYKYSLSPKDLKEKRIEAIKAFYLNAIENGHYKSPKEYTLNIIKFDSKGKKDDFAKDFKIKANSILNNDDLISSLKNEFKELESKEEIIKVIDGKKLEFNFKKDINEDVLFQLINDLIENKITFYSNENYSFILSLISENTQINYEFDDIIDKVIEDFSIIEGKKELIKEVDKIIESFDSEGVFGKSDLLGTPKTSSLSFISTDEASKNKVEKASALVLFENKAKGSNLRKNASFYFIDEENGKIKVFGVKKIEYSNNNKIIDNKIHLEAVLNCLRENAKITIYGM